MYDWNEAVRSLNVGLPDEIARLKAAGYYQEAIARIDRLLAEDWTKTQNGPASNGIAPPEGYVPPENPTPHGVDALREALTVQKEIMRRLPGEYCWTEAEAIARMQKRVRDFTAEEFKKLDWEGRMDWRFVEGEKRYQARFAETLLATHADLAARKLTPDASNNKNEERHRLHEKMEREGSASADITLRTSIRMSDEAFAAALEKAKAEGRDAVHVRAWLALPAACPSQSHITLDRFTETPAHIAAEDAPQRTVCWEADLTENRTFGAEYSYRETAVYADPLSFTPDPEQPEFCTGEEAPHIVFTPYLRALAAQLTEGIASPAEKAKRIYDYVTLNVRYHFQPSYFVHESIAENCARSRPGRLRHHGADLHHPLPHRGHPGPVGERLCSGPGGRGLSRLGAVLRRPQGLDVCRLLLRCLHGPPGAMKCSAATISAVWIRAAWWQTAPLKRPSTRRCWASAATPTTTRAARWRPTAWACTVTIP